MTNKSAIDEFVKERVLIYLKKNKDYGDSFLKSILKFGEVSALVRIDDKVNRYLQLSGGVENEVKDEKKEDTLLDLFNYCMMFRAYVGDGARILLTDLVNAMVEEANILLYGEMENSFIYDMCNKSLDLSSSSIEMLLEDIKKQIV